MLVVGVLVVVILFAVVVLVVCAVEAVDFDGFVVILVCRLAVVVFDIILIVGLRAGNTLFLSVDFLVLSAVRFVVDLAIVYGLGLYASIFEVILIEGLPVTNSFFILVGLLVIRVACFAVGLVIACLDPIILSVFLLEVIFARIVIVYLGFIVLCVRFLEVTFAVDLGATNNFFLRVDVLVLSAPRFVVVVGMVVSVFVAAVSCVALVFVDCVAGVVDVDGAVVVLVCRVVVIVLEEMLIVGLRVGNNFFLLEVFLAIRVECFVDGIVTASVILLCASVLEVIFTDDFFFLAAFLVLSAPSFLIVSVIVGFAGLLYSILAIVSFAFDFCSIRPTEFGKGCTGKVCVGILIGLACVGTLLPTNANDANFSSVIPVKAKLQK